jgi:SRSO17 transposase
MTKEELEQWQEEFEAFHARFADLFERSESHEQAKKYLRGLLTEAERKNSWQVAEAVWDRIPDRMQRLLYRVPWDADAARDRLQQFVSETDRGTKRRSGWSMRPAFSRKEHTRSGWPVSIWERQANWRTGR